jgi:hypothetical protein
MPVSNHSTLHKNSEDGRLQVLILNLILNLQIFPKHSNLG